MLGAAEQLLKETGLTAGIDHVNLEELIRQVGVPRTSAFKEFGDKESFVTDLTLRLLQSDGPAGAAFSPETIATATSVIEENSHLMGNREGRERVLREAIRIGALQNYRDVLSSVSWKTYMAVSVALPGLDQSRREPIVQALRIAEARFVTEMADFYGALLEPFRRRVRSGHSLEQIAAAGSAVVEGLAQRHVMNPEIVDTPLMLPGLDGKLVEWHLAAVGFWAVIDGMTEVDS